MAAVLVFEGVLSQELARYAFIRLYDRVEKGVASARELRGVALNDMTSALCSRRAPPSSPAYPAPRPR